MKRGLHSQSGFTLLELIVALTLASLAAVVGAVALRAAVDYTFRARGYLEDQENLRAASRQLRGQWQSWNPGRIAGDASLLEFDVTPPLLSAPPDMRPRRVRWLCLGDEAGNIKLRYEAYGQPPVGGQGNADGAAAESSVQLPIEVDDMLIGLSACGFEYLALAGEGKEKVSAWLGQWPGNDGTSPTAIRLSLRNRQGEVPPLFLTVRSR